MNVGDQVEVYDNNDDFDIIRIVQRGSYIVGLNCNNLPSGRAIPVDEVNGNIDRYLHELINNKIYRLK